VALHSLLAAWTAELPHAYEVPVPARPGLSRTALGMALHRAGRPGKAVEQLRRAVAANPFDREAARVFGDTLNALDDTEGRVVWSRIRRLLPGRRRRWCRRKGGLRAPPRGAELVSLLLRCGDQPERTQRCLDKRAAAHAHALRKLS